MPLRIFAAADMSTSLLASVQGLVKDEAIIVQWVVTPAIPMRPPVQRPARRGLFEPMRSSSNHLVEREEVREQRLKLKEPNLLAVLRVGAFVASRARADQLLYGVRSALVSASGPSSHFTKRFVLRRALQRRIDEAKAPFSFPIRLSVPELAALLAFPVGEPYVAGLPQSRSRHLPPSAAISRQGLVVARSNFPGVERPIAIAREDVCKHLHILGPIGSGKTVLAGNLVSQAMRARSAVIVMESKGDLFNLALDTVPRSRLADVIVVDITDSCPVGFNLLGEGDPRIVVEEICQLFEYLYPDMRRGVWARSALHRGLSTLVTRPGTTFIDLVPLLSPSARSETEQLWRDELIAAVRDPELSLPLPTPLEKQPRKPGAANATRSPGKP